MSLNAFDFKIPYPGELWGFRCESGKKYSLIMRQLYILHLAILDPTSERNGKEYVKLVLERDGSVFGFFNLHKEKRPQLELNLFFSKGEKWALSHKGQGAVYLTFYPIKVNSGQSVDHLQSNKNSSISVLPNTPLLSYFGASTQESDDSSEDEYTSSEDDSDDGMETDENKSISEIETSSEAPSSQKKKNKADDSTTANESNVSIQDSTTRTKFSQLSLN